MCVSMSWASPGIAHSLFKFCALFVDKVSIISQEAKRGARVQFKVYLYKEDKALDGNPVVVTGGMMVADPFQLPFRYKACYGEDHITLFNWQYPEAILDFDLLDDQLELPFGQNGHSKA